MPSFIFGGNTNETAESLRRKRDIAEALLARSQGRVATDFWEGLNQFGQALGARIRLDGANRGLEQGKKRASDSFAGLFATPSGRAPTPKTRIADTLAKTSKPRASDGKFIRYTNNAAIRNKPLNDKLTGALSFLPELGVTAEVFSGGQDAKGHGHRRTGSTRHDHGNAADVFFYKDGRKLDWANPQDRPVFEEIVRRGKAAGLTGFGAGPGYMQQGSMHIGFGAPAVWGAGGRGANAPAWLQAAYNSPAQAAPVQVASADPGFVPTPQPAPQVPQAAEPVVTPTAAPAPGIAPPAPLQPQQQALPARLRGMRAMDEDYQGPNSVPGAFRNFAQSIEPAAQPVIPPGSAGQPVAPQDIQPPALAQPAPIPAGNVQDVQNAQFGGPFAGASNEELAGFLNEPFASDEQKKIVMQELQRRMTPPDPMKDLQIQKLQRELDTPPERKTIKDANGRLRFLDTGELTFPDLQVSPGFRTLDKSEVEELGLPAGSYQIDKDGKISQIGKSGVTVNVGQSEVGTIPQGYELFTDPKTNARSMRPIAGGPAAVEAEKVARQNEIKQAATERAGNVVVQDIDRVIERVNKGERITGLAGAAFSKIPTTDAFNAAKLLDTIKANAGFDKLQAMRDASPTGGALGQVSEFENRLLQATIGNLEQSQDQQQFVDNLNRVRNIYLDIIHGPSEGPERRELSFEQGQGADPTKAPEGVDPEVWKFMTPEERGLWQN